MMQRNNTTVNATLWLLLAIILCCCKVEEEGFFVVGMGNDESKESQQNHYLSQVAIAVPLFFHSGSYHVYLNVGSPTPQRQLVIVDTGSHYTAFPCEPCKHCGRNTHAAAHFFRPQSSATFQTVPCDQCHWVTAASAFHHQGPKQNCRISKVCPHTQKYTEGSSWTALESQDYVFLATDHVEESLALHQQLAVPFVFGCQTEETGLFISQYADGIMGMAMHPNSLLSQLYSTKSIANMAFSMCIDGSSIYHNYYASSSAASYDTAVKGGLFTMGGVHLQDLTDLVHHTTSQPMQFIELVKDKGWFTVAVQQVYIVSATTGEHIPVVTNEINSFNTGKGTIVDSGTTDTFFPKDLGDILSNAWEKVAMSLGLKYGNKMISLTDTEFAKLPFFKLILRGESTYGKEVEWTIHPNAYFEPVATTTRNNPKMLRNRNKKKEDRIHWEGKRSFTNRIYLDEANGAVLGANSMIDHHVLFDVGNHRIGIAPADCSEFDDVVHAS